LFTLYMGRVLSFEFLLWFLTFSWEHYSEHYQRKGGGNVNKRRPCEQYQLRLEVLNSSEVVGHKQGLECLWRWNYSHLQMPMLVHDILDPTSLLRSTHMQNSNFTTWRSSYCRMALSILWYWEKMQD
jgi:hypothetical protein